MAACLCPSACKPITSRDFAAGPRPGPRREMRRPQAAMACVSARASRMPASRGGGRRRRASRMAASSIASRCRCFCLSWFGACLAGAAGAGCCRRGGGWYPIGRFSCVRVVAVRGLLLPASSPGWKVRCAPWRAVSCVHGGGPQRRGYPRLHANRRCRSPPVSSARRQSVRGLLPFVV